mmetsp:Transcript_35069/g.71780  ORF Transcript_35069/g.71780 Transcript_35069/m.71780 type:complete len:267 (-) Transcript_35069:435-1235(-)
MSDKIGLHNHTPIAGIANLSMLRRPGGSGAVSGTAGASASLSLLRLATRSSLTDSGRSISEMGTGSPEAGSWRDESITAVTTAAASMTSSSPPSLLPVAGASLAPSPSTRMGPAARPLPISAVFKICCAMSSSVLGAVGVVAAAAASPRDDRYDAAAPRAATGSSPAVASLAVSSMTVATTDAAKGSVCCSRATPMPSTSLRTASLTPEDSLVDMRRDPLPTKPATGRGAERIGAKALVMCGAWAAAQRRREAIVAPPRLSGAIAS